MAYSKIFSGDLPELLNEIIQYFHHDYKTLHSCILVNRLWCRLAIPLLWEDPFSIPTLNCRFIDIYLSYLNEDCKLKLNEYGINNNLFPSNTFFNYPSFIQHLDTRKISNSIENWVAQLSYSIQNNNLQITNFTKLIYSSLFLIFIENEVKLRSLEVSLLSHQVCEYFDEAFELILKNPNFICDIKNLKLDFIITAETITKLLLFLNSNCNSISSLYFLFPSYYNNYPINEKSLSQIIDSQENLKKILLGYNNFPLYHSLLSLKNSNCSNTLNTIVFYYIDFNNIIVFNEVFNQLNVLESIHIIYCHSLDIKFIQQIINITKPFKLKSLFLNELLNIESLKLLIQKFGNNLEDFGICISNITDKSQQLIQLFESVLKYCQKIKFLYLPVGLNNQNINLLFNLIDNIKQNLNYLRIDALDYDNHFSSNILQNLGKILPLKLEYLNLGLVINNYGNDLEVFLKNSQNTFIKKLLIRNKKEDESDDIFPYIREYIMKKKRVKYLAILETIDEKCEDLFSLKDKVKELELYDIQVLYYYNLYIDIYCFVKENYLQ
ncbi:uncharacterized protein OCT59_020332 [Rhizophagus irregularis]|nr:hypothetical protein GLOIN_2v1869164 [Rhizophagus irregularis DAOM 181602=DAOM 197198]EXX57887.1 hypothetical protein RirG_202940 [Rhizophagus irregularis DAOM 197198w]PKY14499.1 hypothetical protein RhiirB3_426503 [Rhizophagus irregularis]POG80240.1 hypothetical protein GLOIN_2v1869164 [Rhizophagus irregularis DAOM 181602=DAOM 197198]UZO01822.1 hypothetical protein OCT59_020332 [Rhizophagus irregularis]|eukprot:XP_025187106.1 hypothetical protein GLOIN_2v1869164 [Rhizophagus irregularis DAOM 181602=DAOM 197198]